MFPVVSKTQPAELVATLAARHVHTPLVFLDIAFALRAGFGV